MKKKHVDVDERTREERKKDRITQFLPQVINSSCSTKHVPGHFNFSLDKAMTYAPNESDFLEKKIL